MKKIEEKIPYNDLGITGDNLLSLDIATHCGYYSKHSAGTWDFSKKGIHEESCHLSFYNKLKSYCTLNNIKMIVAEDVNVNNHFIDMRKLCEFRGILFLVCAELGMPHPAFVNVVSVKKWATGDGHADKQMMMDYCRTRWHIDPGNDDNMADATHIFMYYKRIYKLE